MTTETIKREVLKEMDIDALLNVAVNEIQEVSERVLFPSAVYQTLVIKGEVEAGTESSGAYIAVTHEVVAVVELSDDKDAESAPEVGTHYTERYYPGYGFENFRTVYRDACQLLEAGDAARLGELLEALPNTSWETLIEHKSRTDKETKEVKWFNQINPHATFMIGDTE